MEVILKSLIDRGAIVEIFASGGSGYIVSVRWGGEDAVDEYVEYFRDVALALVKCETALKANGFR